MNYQLWHNESARFLRAYEPGDQLIKGWTGEFPACFSIRKDIPLEQAITNLAETIWKIHNSDDRPDGQLAPSLSVGDVVQIGEVALSVDRCGWKLVALEHSDDSYR